jgi:phosphate transport system permease protein
MPLSTLAIVLLALTVFGFLFGQRRAVAFRADARARNGPPLHSQPGYHGWFVVVWCGLPALVLLLVWIALEGTIIRSLVIDSLPPEVKSLDESEIQLIMAQLGNVAYGVVTLAQVPETIRDAVASGVGLYNSLRATANAAIWVLALSLCIAGLLYARRQLGPQLRARHTVERVANVVLFLCSLIAILTTVGIVLSLVFEATRFFARVPVTEFLFGTVWSPQTAIRADQVGSSGAFGAVPLFAGTLLIATIAMIVALPIGLMSAIYLSEYAPGRVRAVVKPALEILAGIPTVVYGFFAALTVAPAVRALGEAIGLQVAAQSALAAGLVMGIMIVPFVSSLSDDVINAVPQSLRDGSYGLGATRSETVKQVVLPAAIPGIAASFILALSRALGETMIVVMAAGLAANISANPLAAVSTVTVHIAALLVGDQEFDSPKTLSAFALGLVLFVVTLTLNLIALRVVQAYREKYD